jgi:hypothetical protein
VEAILCEKIGFNKRGDGMAGVLEGKAYNRLEGFITLAKEGKEVNLDIDLKKQIVAQKVHPGDTEEMRNEIEMYLLSGEYTFRVGSESRHISKIYVAGTVRETLDDTKQNISIANARLDMDYKRLREANITFKKKHF